MLTLRRAAGLAAALLISGVALAGCTGSHSSDATAGKSAAQSIAAQPTVSADIAQLENELLASYQKNFTPAHPIKSMETTLHAVFPSASLSATATFAVDHLTTAMAHKTAAGKAARDEWAQTVTEHILTENPNATLPPGSAAVPGVTNPATTPSAGSS
jgi:hypothetical protein